MYLLPVNLIMIIVKITEIGVEISEYQAKPIHPAISLVLSQKNTIEIINRIPERTTSARCIFPLQVLGSPPSSRGKKMHTKIPRNAQIENKTGPTIDPVPSIPQKRPKENINNNIIPMVKREVNNHLL